jgi:mitogen-activated protein kinase 1/3
LDLNDTKRIYREIKLLSNFSKLEFLKHTNIIKLIDIILPESETEYNDYYLIFEFMPTDLEKVINSKQVCNII